MIRNKYKALSIHRDEIIKDINHQSWRTSKEYIISGNTNNVADASIQVVYDDVLYDVDYTTWKIANVRITDSESRAEAQTDGGNEKWHKRHYKLAVEQVKSILRPFLSNTNSVSDSETNTIQLRFSNKWTGSFDVIQNCVHHFVVDTILAEWFSMTMPDAAASHVASVESWKEKMLNEAHSEEVNYDWFERQLATAVDHMKGELSWCIAEHTGTIVDNTIKQHAIPYGSPDYPAVEQDFPSFEDDIEFLEAPAEKYVPIPEHIFKFKFSDTWRGNFEALGNYIHRYIVDYILYEWFKMTLPSEASVYLASAGQWESKIINEARSEDVRDVFFRL